MGRSGAAAAPGRPPSGRQLQRYQLLGPLGNHGGLTQTRLPARTSQVINAGDPAFAARPDTDQRGVPRVWGGRVDIGAVETVELFLPLARR